MDFMDTLFGLVLFTLGGMVALNIGGRATRVADGVPGTPVLAWARRPAAIQALAILPVVVGALMLADGLGAF